MRIFLIIYLLAISLPFRAAAQQTNTVSQARLLLLFTKNIFTNGEPVNAIVVLTNLSDSPLSVHDNYGQNLTFTVSIETNHQDSFIGKKWPDIAGGPEPVEVVIPPHGVIITTNDVSHAYDLKPGIYKIRANRELTNRPPWKVITSPVETIKIVDGSKKSQTATNSIR